MTETTNWLLVIIAFIGLVLTVVMPLVAYLNSVTTKTRNELSEHKTHVAEFYAKKGDVTELGERMERQMSAGFSNLKELIINHKFKEMA